MAYTLPQGGLLELDPGMRLLTQPYWYDLQVDTFDVQVKLMPERILAGLNGGRIVKLFIFRRPSGFLNSILGRAKCEATYEKGWVYLSEDPQVRTIVTRILAAFGEPTTPPSA